MIAVILLIAFTVAIGGILSVWLTGLQQQQTTVTGEYAEKVAKCANSVLTVSNITNTLIQVSYDAGTYPLQPVSLTVVFDDANYTATECASSLSPGNVCIKKVDDLRSGMTMDNVKSIRAIGMCLGEVAITASWPV